MKTVNQLLAERKNYPLKIKLFYLFSAFSHCLFGGMILLLYFIRAGIKPVPSFRYYTADLISLPRASSHQGQSAASTGKVIKADGKKEPEPKHQVVSPSEKKKEPEKKEERKEAEMAEKSQQSRNGEKTDDDSGTGNGKEEADRLGFSISGGGNLPGGGASLNGLDMRFAWYRATVVDILNNNWIQVSDDYTQQNLTVIVRFCISSDGSVSDVLIEKSSGSALLDRGVRRAIQASNPFPPIPLEFGKDRLTARFKFIY